MSEHSIYPRCCLNCGASSGYNSRCPTCREKHRVRCLAAYHRNKKSRAKPLSDAEQMCRRLAAIMAVKPA